jgi:hypothetical protein
MWKMLINHGKRVFANKNVDCFVNNVENMWISMYIIALT